MKKILVMLLLLSTLLSSCDSPSTIFPFLNKGLPLSKRIPLLKNENYVKPNDKKYSELEYADYFEIVTTTDIFYKADNKESFVVYFYSLGCYNCIEVKPLFLRYICETKYVFNALEVSENGENVFFVASVLKEHFGDDFNDNDFGTPKLYFFLEGKIIADSMITKKQRNDYDLLKDLLNSYVKPKEINE